MDSPVRLTPAVYIVGAGPGDPELLTVKAQKIIAAADVILFADALVPLQILQGVRPDAEIIRTGNKTLEDILPVMIERVLSQQSVVRLHSGDPSLYSAVHEQMQALAQAGIPFEVIPGISAFQLAAAKLKVELTVPGLVQTIILTRISGRTEVPASEELASLAEHQASLCLYLSARHVESATEQLMQHYPPETKVAICFRLGWPDEKILVVPLHQMAAVTEQEKLIRTTLYVISPALGEVEKVRSRLYHPEHTHLFRPGSKHSHLSRSLENMHEIKCPKCQGSFEQVPYANIEVDRCTDCHGIWFDSLEAQALKKVKGAETIDIGDPKTGKKFNQVGDINCPKCSTKMTKMVDVKQHHIWYEKCPLCYGIWFDAGEFKDFKEESINDFFRDMFSPKRN